MLRTRIVIVDPLPDRRLDLRALLEADELLEVVGTASSMTSGAVPADGSTATPQLDLGDLSTLPVLVVIGALPATASTPAKASPPAAPAVPDVTAMLSPRECDVVQMLAEGRSNQEIAHALHLAESTVKAYLSSVMAKWRARDRVQVLLHALRSGIVRIGE